MVQAGLQVSPPSVEIAGMHHHARLPELLCIPKYIKGEFFILPQPVATTTPLSVSVNLTILNTSYVGPHNICVLCMVYFSTVFSTFNYVVTGVRVTSFKSLYIFTYKLAI
jgi:hypothetical protein